LRFSSKTDFWIRNATRLSLVLWLTKTTVALINLIIFGIYARNGDDWVFAEGFWCAVVSVIDSGIISLALIFHFFLCFGKENEDSTEVRHEGQKFMLSVTAFLVILGFQALAFNRIEGWAYADAIYFSVQTALTIGYGDFVPTTTAGKVLVFPFSVLTISQLGNEIALIIAFIAARSGERRDKWRRKYEGAMHREANKLRPDSGLVEEMALIQQINSREEM
jgi:potassium channel subfamily K